MPDSPAERMVGLLKADPRRAVTASDLQQVFNHIHERFDRSPVESSLQGIVKKVIGAVAVAEHEIDVEEAQRAVRSAEQQVHNSHHQLDESQRRLAELTGTT
ncbi:hypothetical protein ORI20_13940 [Mycobacterium sp. CVI_P3]|uniref:hypothetical protein n=1 Tax=Mycobacterium pinniadriaticum TaxID=2994102 RepID=UPI002249537F|nr:hypothetical protein [Mycobacterium pinniadriaticum]MCX2931381.1 hypothetical protein [Mycobacterium pinniadriaticum]